MRLLTSGPGVGYPLTTTAGALSYASAGTTTTNVDMAPHTATTAASSVMTKIRPRGLINSGNMCFANSVLQIMVYCPPFHRLFAELGRVLVLSGVGSGAGFLNGGVTGGSGVNKANGVVVEESRYPLVDATVEFLREFVVVDDSFKESKEKERNTSPNPNININGRGPSGSISASASASASSSSASSSRTAAASSRGGKGKDRERGDSVSVGYVPCNGGAGEMKEAEDGGESFLPTYVYDAMKVKKRFEHMRVSWFFFSLMSPFFPSLLRFLSLRPFLVFI